MTRLGASVSDAHGKGVRFRTVPIRGPFHALWGTCVQHSSLGKPPSTGRPLSSAHVASASVARITRTAAVLDVRRRPRAVMYGLSLEYALAVRALAAEEGRGGCVDPVIAGDRVLARLRDQLLLWFGPDGVYALFARAIDRASAVHPVLVDVRPIPQGGRHLDRVGRTVRGDRTECLREALVVFLATLFALLARLIGQDLVVLVTNQAWPGGETNRIAPSS